MVKRLKFAPGLGARRQCSREAIASNYNTTNRQTTEVPERGAKNKRLMMQSDSERSDHSEEEDSNGSTSEDEQQNVDVDDVRATPADKTLGKEFENSGYTTQERFRIMQMRKTYEDYHRLHATLQLKFYRGSEV